MLARNAIATSQLPAKARPCFPSFHRYEVQSLFYAHTLINTVDFTHTYILATTRTIPPSTI